MIGKWAVFSLFNIDFVCLADNALEVFSLLQVVVVSVHKVQATVLELIAVVLLRKCVEFAYTVNLSSVSKTVT